MRKLILPILGVLSVLPNAAPAAEVASQGPPPVLAITREDIKPGRMDAHNKLNAGFVAAVSKTKSQSHWLGLTPVSGDENVTVFLQGFRSFEEVEAMNKETEALAASATPAAKAEFDQLERQSADLHETQKTAFARYRPDLSYRPGSMSDVAQSRYFNIVTVRVKPGRGPDYIDYTKAMNKARERAGVDQHSVVYQAATGAPSGTFYVFIPHRSLKEWDESRETIEARFKAIDEALGGEAAARGLRLSYSEMVASSESAIYAMKPSISRPAPEFAAADVAFWNPKPLSDGKALAVKKETKKETPKP